MAAQKKIPKRSEVDKQYTWATEDLFATDELWEKALEDAKKYIPMAETYKGRLGESADTLYGALNTLKERGWITLEGGADGRRKDYAITEKGRQVLMAELARLKELVQNGEKVLEGK